MSNLDSSVLARPDLEIPQSLSAHPPPAHHVGLLDRLSLRLGLWLLLRSARQNERRLDREAHARSLRDERAREVRDHAAQREHLLHLR